jgi:hypothetical protein
VVVIEVRNRSKKAVFCLRLRLLTPGIDSDECYLGERVTLPMRHIDYKGVEESDYPEIRLQ